MKRIALLIVLGVIVLSGCNHDMIEPDGTRDIVVFFTPQSLSASLLKSEANADEKTINEILIFGVDAAENYVVQDFTLIENPSLTGGITLTEVSRHVKWLYAIANPAETIKNAPTPATISDLMALTFDLSSSPEPPFVMSGKGQVVNEQAAKIELVRTVAKIEITAIENFLIQKITVTNTPNEGYVFKQESVTAQTTTTYVETYDEQTSAIIYVAENSNTTTPTMFTVTGLFDGESVDYVIDFKQGVNQVIIERNKHYQIGVTAITHSEGSFTISIPDWDDVETDVVLMPTPQSPTNPYKDGIKILAIGNSFSEDVMRYMFDMLQQLGVNPSGITLMTAWISGGTLQQHAANIGVSSAANLERRVFTENGGQSGYDVTGQSLLSMIKEQPWDIITLQQQSTASGLPDWENHWDGLDALIEYVNLHATNPSMRLGWHMTWASPTGNWIYGSPPNLPYLNQIDMFTKICEAVQSQILTAPPKFDFVIPTGTAFQNARSLSHFGDNLNNTLLPADIHANNLGSYIGAATWIAKITGLDISKLLPDYPADKHYPPNRTISADDIVMISNSVNAAISNPFSITYP